MYDMSDRCDLWLLQQEQRLARLPVCSECRQPIQDDFMFCIDGQQLCEDCWDKYVDENFRRMVEDD